MGHQGPAYFTEIITCKMTAGNTKKLRAWDFNATKCGSSYGHTTVLTLKYLFAFEIG